MTEGELMRMWIQLLGPFQVHVGGKVVALPPRLQRLLVGLVRTTGEPVARTSLLEWIWDKPSDGAPRELDKLMTSLKRELGALGLTDVVISGNKQTSLNIPEDYVDVHQFERKVRAAARHQGNDRETARTLREALKLSVGEPLAGLDGLKIDSYRQTLKGKQHAALTRCLDAELRLGYHKRLLPEVTELDRAHPLDDEISRMLVLTRFRTNGRDDALKALRSIEERRAEQLGASLGPGLQDLRQRILRRDPKLLQADASQERPTEATSATPPLGVAEGAQNTTSEADARPVTMGGVYIQAGGDIRSDGGIIAGGNVIIGPVGRQPR